MTGVISGKPSMPLTNGYSIGSPNRRARASRRGGGRSWSRRKITRWSSQALRIAATVSASSSRARSTPKISAPIAPDSGRISSPFFVMTAILPPRLGRAQPPAAQRRARYEPTAYGEFTHCLLALNFAHIAATVRPVARVHQKKFPSPFLIVDAAAWFGTKIIGEQGARRGGDVDAIRCP